MKGENKTESISHILGKELAKHLLKSKRFYDYEIKEEYPVIFPTGKIRLIDIVGISIATGKKIAFEIGDLHGGSLEELHLFFDEVYNIEKLIIESNNLRKLFEFYNKELKYYKEEIINLRNKYGKLHNFVTELNYVNYFKKKELLFPINDVGIQIDCLGGRQLAKDIGLINNIDDEKFLEFYDFKGFRQLFGDENITENDIKAIEEIKSFDLNQPYTIEEEIDFVYKNVSIKNSKDYSKIYNKLVNHRNKIKEEKPIEIIPEKKEYDWDLYKKIIKT